MGEAGRAPDTPLTMAPPNRGDSDEETLHEAVPPTGVMAPPSKASSGEAEEDDGTASGANGKAPRSGLGTGERVSTGQEKTEGTSAGQVVRQAVAATNNWFTGRAQKAAAPAVASPKDSPDGEKPADAPAEPAAAPAPAPARAASTGPSPVTPKETVKPAVADGSSPAVAATTTTSGTGTTQRLGYTPPWTAKPAAAAPKKERRNRRQAHLTVSRVEPWSVMKFSFVVSVVAFVVMFVAVAVLYAVLSGLGVFTSLQHLVNTVTSSKSSAGTNITGWFSASRILGYTGMLGSLNIVLITAMATIGAVVYNLIAKVFGGVEITLRETD